MDNLNLQELGGKIAEFLRAVGREKERAHLTLWPENFKPYRDLSGFEWLSDLSDRAKNAAVMQAAALLREDFEVSTVPASASVADWMERLRAHNYYIQASNEGWMDGDTEAGAEPWQALERYAAEVKVAVGAPIINVTPHPITFLVGERVVNVPPSGIVVNARPVEQPAGKFAGVELVRTGFEADPAATELLKAIWTWQMIPVGSMIAAQAYPGKVLAMVPAPGFERVPPDQKRMRPDKFTTFA